MKQLICIVCPKGCHLQVDEENGYAVTGNCCERGAAYGAGELKNPLRVITSTVVLTGGLHRRLPVKTSVAVPKAKIADVMRCIAGIQVKTPVRTGEVLLAGIAGTDADLVASKTDLGGLA